MRVTVNAQDDFEVWDGCFGSVNEDGSLTIIQFADSGIHTDYQADEWDSYMVEKES